MDEDPKIPVYVEAEIRAQSRAKPGEIKERVEAMLKGSLTMFQDGPVDFEHDEFLAKNLQLLRITDISLSKHTSSDAVPVWQAELQVRVFVLNDEGAEDEGDGEATSCQIWMLPSKSMSGLWESLVMPQDEGTLSVQRPCPSEVKSHLLDYAESAMHFADRRVDVNIVSWNRVVLLHGPPGTGKTSLCKALAQKLSIRLSDRYRYGQLVEVNAHSLFSKWFSESGKLVNKLFDTIRDLLDDPDVFVCVLIDEVESLTAARKSALNGNEPSDAIRVVNALLTQIDQLKERPNAMVMTTSNITEAIDLAFVDRADIKQYIGLPSALARYQILSSCVEELARVGIIAESQPLLPSTDLTAAHKDHASSLPNDPSARLFAVATDAEGLSGRALRKLPFLAHAMFVQRRQVTIDGFMDALSGAVRFEHSARQDQAKAGSSSNS